MAEDPRPERWWKRRARKRSERSRVDPERFFLCDYPRVIARDVRAYSRLTGRIAIAVRGIGEWTLVLGDVDNPVVPAFDRNAAARICFAPTAFGDFLSGDLDVKSAMEAGAVAVRGDRALIRNLARILNPPRSILAARAEPW